MKKIFYYICIVACLVVTKQSLAQTVTTPVSSAVFHQAEAFTIPITIESATTPINAFSFTVTIPNNLTFVGSDEAGSVVSLWIDSPHLENGKVILSGAMPTGFTQLINPLNKMRGPGLVTKLIFSGNDAGEGTITVTPSVYANDGLGTKVASAGFSIPVSIDDKVVRSAYVWQDAILPEQFTPTIEQNPVVEDNAYTVVFSAIDKDSGIAHYEIKEGNGLWIEATSPYVLRDQTLSSTIDIKAVDKAGNERVVRVVVHAVSPVERRSKIVIVFLALCVAITIVVFRKKIFKVK